MAVNPVCLVIPTYNPTERLLGILEELSPHFQHVIVVNDGSNKPDAQAVIESIAHMPGITLLQHAINLGKGNALKTAFNYAAVHFKGVGVVTADDDGQHASADILNVAQSLHTSPTQLVLGVRSFDQNVPFKSRFGNLVTRSIVRMIAGLKLTDTQTGLRGIPFALLAPLLRIPSKGYEFELDMLIFCKKEGIAIQEVPIQTLYFNQNKASHFRPLFDSMKIYFVFIRFAFSSILTATVDYAIFTLTFVLMNNLLLSQVSARAVAGFFNFTLNKKAVFNSDEGNVACLLKYILLVATMGLLSHTLILSMAYYLDWNVFVAKLAAEGMLFLASFAIQRDFIFTKKVEHEAYSNRLG